MTTPEGPMDPNEPLPDDERLSMGEIHDARSIEQPIADLWERTLTQESLDQASQLGVFTRPRQCGCPLRFPVDFDGVVDFTHARIDHTCGRPDEALPSET